METKTNPGKGNRSDIRGHRAKGTPKTGGRKAGTPNRVTKSAKQKITEVTSEYFESEVFVNDLAELTAKERIDAMYRLTTFVLPKPQEHEVTVTDSATASLEQTLIALSGITTDDEE